MIFVLFLTTAIVGFMFWFYKKKQIEALITQLNDRDAIISALTLHVETKSVKPTVDITKPNTQTNTSSPKKIKSLVKKSNNKSLKKNNRQTQSQQKNKQASAGTAKKSISKK